ncbi:LOW QUALITY PROTEIN: G-protein coupled receptor-associated protein LMBRD2-like [Paramacrobiotus metropolitanus]|uniref:LOW QUALITY PROTEIN: G-protein coupled receptor-associated protein LMBRD2-like n=1 Tax=Paramacrobiotus metropolitanus TaxID=2943436 RepID=UPI0024458D12|nr:LOW QUALITY PROTEIN: G-protein coupled receptor-associated protein LMBRD2-like [Paramacrobiotus metropolitanus]
MAAVVLGLNLVLVFILTLFLLHQYGNWRTQHPIVTTAVFVSWYFSFLIIFILPMDVSSTLYQSCVTEQTEKEPVDYNETGVVNSSSLGWENVSSHLAHDDLERNETWRLHAIRRALTNCEAPWSYVPREVLPVLWRMLYWTSQFLTWLLLPIMQSYAMAGEFSVLGKLLTSLKRNAIYYGTYLLIFGLLLIYVAAKPELKLDWSKLVTLVITASNTWGLFLLILLLGYGLVEIPRACWRASNLSYQLAYTQFKLAKSWSEKAEAEEEVDDVLQEIRKASDRLDTKHSLRKFLDLIISKCPEDFRQKLANPTRASNGARSSDSSTMPTERALVQIHKKLISAIHRQFRTSTTWFVLLDEGFELEDCIRNKSNADKTFRPTFPVPRGKLYAAVCTPKIEWIWKCLLRQWILMALSIVFIVFSAMVVWSECTFFVKDPVLSVFAEFVQLASRHNEYFNVEVASFFSVTFLAFCTYYTVFKIRFFNYYHLAPRHQTDENSLIFCGTMLCRLTSPMCLNFLGLIHMDSHVIKIKTAETAFTRIMGHMDVLPIISDGFNVYFPMLILVLCLATYFRLGTRILNFLGFQQFMGDDNMAVDLINEGRDLMQRERRRRLRAEETKSRRDQLMELVNNTSNFGRIASSNGTQRPASRWSQRNPSRDTTPGFRYKNFQNEEPTVISDFPSSSRNATEETDSAVGSSIAESRDRNYQSTAPAEAPASSFMRYPPRNIFDDV